jgi:hypothetical protein
MRTYIGSLVISLLQPARLYLIFLTIKNLLNGLLLSSSVEAWVVFLLFKLVSIRSYGHLIKIQTF